MREFGITVEDFARLMNAQEMRCAGCREPLEFDHKTHIDHDHKTGKVRGLLCHYCNILLGVAKDDVGTLRRLVKYLERSRQLELLCTG